MVPSLFNVYSHLRAGRVAVLNTRTLNLVVLEDEELSELMMGRDPTGDRLSALGLLSGSHDEEVQEALRSFEASKCRTGDGLALTVAPTFACNFACSYCVNGIHQTDGKTDPVDAAVQYSSDELKAGEPLHITWFGGEPLLAVGAIERGMLRFQEVARQNGSCLTADIVTNGFFLNPRIADRCFRHGVERAQISFDVPFSHSDRRTAKRSAKSLFDRWVQWTAEYPPGFEIALRLNAKVGFLEDIQAIADVFASAPRTPAIYIHPVIPTAFSPGEETIKSEEELYRFYDEYRRARRWLVAAGMASPQFPSSSSSACTACKPRERYFTTEGIRTCVRELTGPGASIVNGIPNHIAQRYRASKPVSSALCTKCAYLPVCNGGCPKDVREDRPIPLRCTHHRYTMVNELELVVEAL